MLIVIYLSLKKSRKSKISQSEVPCSGKSISSEVANLENDAFVVAPVSSNE